MPDPTTDYAAVSAELRELIPQMREDAECHRTWMSDQAQRDLQPGSAYLKKYTPTDIAGDAAWHQRWYDFYARVADTMDRAAVAIEDLVKQNAELRGGLSVAKTAYWAARSREA